MKVKGGPTPTSAASLAPFEGPNVARSQTFGADARASVTPVKRGTPQSKDEYIEVSENDAVSALLFADSFLLSFGV